PAIAAIDPPKPQSFDASLVKRGRELAAIGNCGDCHTVRGARNFAGGLPVPTAFGTVYSSNITPDPETGIGRWSEAAFRRARSAEWNRGAYLVEGLAHCGACHTPRNALGAERASASFAGGDVDNWQAYPINAQSPSPVPWDAEALFSYLRDGWHPDHGTARGPMAQVVSNLSSVPSSDVRAIAVYLADVLA